MGIFLFSVMDRYAGAFLLICRKGMASIRMQNS